MTLLPDNDTPTLQREVQRLLGRCMLRLQQYERQIKVLVAHHEISGPSVDLQAIGDRRVQAVARKTLGQLVGELLGSFIIAGEPNEAAEAVTDAPGFSYKMCVSLNEDDFARTESGLRELVELRNNLVHHFLDQHDITSPEGCRNASKAMIAAYDRIDHHLEQLRKWAQYMQSAREFMAEAMAPGTPPYMVVFHGINPDGTVNWQIAYIVEALRRAATELQVDGWTPVDEAGEWVAAHDPELSPQAYGCRSWKQVLQDSRAFEIRYFDKDRQRAAWYRAKALDGKAH